jgi:peptidyl-tRNA hydrolase, PTH1 family
VRLIAGLGNPGKEYRFSRHNLGFMVVDELARARKAGRFWPRFNGRSASVKIGGEEIALLKPYTYMNLSGESVARAMKAFRVDPEGLIVIHDDLDLAPGRLKIAFGGKSGGHKGIESIIARIGSRDFYRIRLGIGKPGSTGDGADYVLGWFEGEERETAEQMINDACAAVETLIRDGLEKAQNRFHKKS